MAEEQKKQKKESRLKKFLTEFKTFISRGNILDMAVGVVVGGAFSKIVTALVNNIIMPLVALAMGGKSLNELVIVLNGVPQYIEDSTGALIANPEANLLQYGAFIQTVIDFLIIAFCVFIFIKIMMSLKAVGEKMKEEALELAEKTRRKIEGACNETSEGVCADADETEEQVE